MATKLSTEISTLKVLEAYTRQAEGFADQVLQGTTGQHPKVCHRALEREYRRGFIEFGVSLRAGWLTAAGKAELYRLRASIRNG